MQEIDQLSVFERQARVNTGQWCSVTFTNIETYSVDKEARVSGI